MLKAAPLLAETVQSPTVLASFAGLLLVPLLLLFLLVLLGLLLLVLLHLLCPFLLG